MIISDQNSWRNIPKFEASKSQTVCNSQSKFTHVDAFPYFAHWNLRRTRKIFSKKYEFGGSDSSVKVDSRLKGICPVVLVGNLNLSNSALRTSNITYFNENIQGDWGEKVYILRKKVHTKMYLILIFYQDRTVGMSRPNSIRFLFVGFDDKRILQNKGWYTRRIAL